MIRTVTKSAAAGAFALAVAGLIAPTAASAQAYDYYGQNYGQSYNSGSYYSRGGRTPGYYDPCERQRDNQVGGGVIGATLGAVAGSQLAANGRRTEGSILGGVLGAAVGAAAGRGNTDQCRYERSSYGYQYDNSDRGYAYDRGYDYDRRYDDRYDDQRYDDRYDYDARYGSNYSSYGDNCQLAESQVRLPDGRYESRYVRTCRDSSGRYRVVD